MKLTQATYDKLQDTTAAMTLFFLFLQPQLGFTWTAFDILSPILVVLLLGLAQLLVNRLRICNYRRRWKEIDKALKDSLNHKD